MDYQEIIYTVKEGIATITFNRPKTMNSLTHRSHDELESAIAEARDNNEVRVLVITGSGRGFCSGDDVKTLFLGEDGLAKEPMEARRARQFKEMQGAHRAGGAGELMLINKPTIAAVNGAAVGYGCDIALMCDMRVASENARFGEVFLRVGMCPDQGMLLLPRLVGLAKAYELMLTTDVIDAQEAERIGLVNQVVPQEDLENATMALATKIAKKSPLAVQLTKEGIRKGLALPLQNFYAFHAQAFDFLTQTEDFQEGSRAFMEKREPRFRGR